LTPTHKHADRQIARSHNYPSPLSETISLQL